MTTAEAPAHGAAAAPSSTSDSPDARALWRGGRGPLIGVLVLLLTGVALALVRSGDGGTLHPESPTPDGSLAVTELLADQGVTTTLVGTSAEAAEAAGPDSTVVVAFPQAVPPSRLAALHEDVIAAGGRMVLVSPGQEALDRVAPGVMVAGDDDSRELDPDCSDATAERAGSATMGGRYFDIASGGTVGPATGCYSEYNLPTLVILGEGEGDGTPDGTTLDAPGDTVLLGNRAVLTNDALADHGNAALTLGLLGTRPDVAWYLPNGEEAPPPQDERGLLELAGDNWRWAAGQLAVAALITAIWRMRRLGPVVSERLPVRVRAAETTEGRARLYHRSGARDRAAEALREAARDRLAPLVGTDAGAPVEELTGAVADRARLPVAEVHDVLAGPAPADDSELVALADRLDALERRISPAPTAATRAAGQRPSPTGSPNDRPTKDTP
ncbi:MULTISPECIES: DUF4350 domain-containing protein [unclassified Streptomyces]|uniref:DUF4350 domain-containing protein n=1 Tax=unclassified Streptomyces TaxID=2593676 RepID=UPI000CD58196|nr:MULTISPECIES: DUF4350 domain-containing protein [unclassified Streptomyces]